MRSRFFASRFTLYPSCSCSLATLLLELVQEVEVRGDELTRGLASGTLSRGKALRLMGAALVGGTLASLPGVAWARRPAGNSAWTSSATQTSRDGRLVSVR